MRNRLAFGGTALLALALLALQISPVLNPPRWDEFIVVYDAHRVATGQVPYRDFFNFIPPGIFLVLGAVFKALGASTLTLGRYMALGAMVATWGFLATALRRGGWPARAACLWALTVPLSLYGFWAIPSHQWLAAASAAGFLAALSGPEPRRGREWFTAGLSVGLAGLFVQTAGATLSAASLVLLGLSHSRRGRAAALWLAGLLSAWLPVALWLALSGGLGAFVRDVIFWPLENYTREGNENSGAPLQDLPERLADIGRVLRTDPSAQRLLTSTAGAVLYAAVAVAALILVACACVGLARILKTRELGRPHLPAAILATFLLLGLTARGSANWLHLLYMMALLGPLWLVALGGWNHWKPKARTGAEVLLGALLVSGALYHARGLWFHSPGAWEWADVDRPIREQAINRFLRSPGVLAPGDTVAAFPEGGEVYLYSAPAAVGTTYFLPLDQHYNSLKDHERVAREMERARPRYVLVTPDLEEDYLDEASPVGRLLRKEYRRAGVIGLAVIYAQSHSSVEQDRLPGGRGTYPGLGVDVHPRLR